MASSLYFVFLSNDFFYRLVYDRETGKPKGYGFCEYKDQETALSAMRNLNGYEIGGRTLRVDNACTEKSRLEMQCNTFFVTKKSMFIFVIFIFYSSTNDGNAYFREPLW